MIFASCASSALSCCEADMLEADLMLTEDLPTATCGVAATDVTAVVTAEAVACPAAGEKAWGGAELPPAVLASPAGCFRGGVLGEVPDVTLRLTLTSLTRRFVVA
jgi:hypothetical protein